MNNKLTKFFLYNPKLLIKEILKKKRKIYPNKVHIKKGIDWLVYAQKISEDGGVSSHYSLISGWGASYPETSGYIIRTLLDYYNFTKNKYYLSICKDIADWECSIQLISGGFQGDVLKKKKDAVIFNTGQVILGLIRAYKEFKKEIYLDCAIQAGNFLINNQETDGNWKRYCFNNISHTYNVRVAWALLELHQTTKQSEFQESAIKNLTWALKQKNENDWFHKNSFVENSPPLLHTIAYTIRGYLESGLILNDNTYLDTALKSSLRLVRYYEKNGFLPARFDSNWQSTDYYSCLTGDAQLSIIWLKLYEIYKNEKLIKYANKLNNYLKSTQMVDFRFKDVDGAIKGSDPIWGMYNAFGFPNWATKFFCDALILEEKILSNKV